MMRLTGDLQRSDDVEVQAVHGIHAALLSAVRSLSPREVEERAAYFTVPVGMVVGSSVAFSRVFSDLAIHREILPLIEDLRGVALRSAWMLRAAAADPVLDDLRARVRVCNDDLSRGAEDAVDSARLAMMRVRRDDLQREMALRIADAARNGVDPESPAADAHALASLLEPGEVVVSYWSFPLPGRSPQTINPSDPSLWSMAAFVLREDGSVACFGLGPVGAIEGAALRWRTALSAPGPGPARGTSLQGTATADPEHDSGVALRRLVLDPLRAVLAGAERVTLLPDAALNLVPLDALPEDDGTRFGQLFDVALQATLRERFLARPALRADGAQRLGGARPIVQGLGGAPGVCCPVSRLRW